MSSTKCTNCDHIVDHSESRCRTSCASSRHPRGPHGGGHQTRFVEKKATGKQAAIALKAPTTPSTNALEEGADREEAVNSGQQQQRQQSHSVPKPLTVLPHRTRGHTSAADKGTAPPGRPSGRHSAQDLSIMRPPQLSGRRAPTNPQKHGMPELSGWPPTHEKRLEKRPDTGITHNEIGKWQPDRSGADEDQTDPVGQGDTADGIHQPYSDQTVPEPIDLHRPGVNPERLPTGPTIQDK